MVTEVEALLPGKSSSQRSQPSLPVDVLPTVLRNLHDFFCHVAARLEKLHDAVAVQREAYLLRRQKVRTFLCIMQKIGCEQYLPGHTSVHCVYRCIHLSKQLP